MDLQQAQEALKQLLAQAGATGIKGWVAGIGASLVLGWLASKALPKLPELVGVAFFNVIRWATEATGRIKNESARVLATDILLAFVRYAEREIPDKGLGQERLYKVEQLLCSLPWIGVLFRVFIGRCRPQFEAAIEAAVKRMDEEAKKAAANGSHLISSPPPPIEPDHAVPPPEA